MTSMYHDEPETVEIEIVKEMQINLYYNERDQVWHAVDGTGVIEVGGCREEAIDKVVREFVKSGFEVET